MTAVPIRNDSHWHELRSQHVGGSEVAALFGQSNWMTAWRLWQIKAGKVATPGWLNERAEWGKRLEPGIAHGIAEDMRWTIRKAPHYLVHDSVPGMGATLDYEIVDHADGPGIVEIKFVAAYATWKEEWTETRGPAGYELQLQHQLACSPAATWGVLACFIGQTATAVMYERKPNPKVIGEIERRVATFWDSIIAGRAPDPIGTVEEWAAMNELWPAPDRDKVVTIPDERLSETAQLYAYGQAQRRSGEKIEVAEKVKLRSALGDAKLARLPGYYVEQRKAGSGVMIVVREGDTGVAHDPKLTEPVDLT